MVRTCLIAGLAVAFFTTFGAACGSSAPVAPSPAPSQGTSPTAVPSSQTGGNAERVSGAIQSFANGKVTLADGKSFHLTPEARVIRTVARTPADLRPGQYVAVTATRQADGTLLASGVNIFAESFRNSGAGQRPLSGGALMTNATIEKVEGSGFTVSFPGGGAQIRLTPDAKLGELEIVTQADLKAGISISAFVTNGIAQSVSLQ